jgi:hypothetical protein
MDPVSYLRLAATLQGLSNKKQQGRRSLKKGGLAYQIDFAAADPQLYIPGKVAPYPNDFSTSDLIVGRGSGDSLIPFAKFNEAPSSGPSGNVKVESLMPYDLYLGQIVPFEIKISVDGLEAAEDGTITFTAGWSTETTSKGAFGYDYLTYGVLAAFIDTGDGAHIDNGPGIASVSDFRWTWENDDEIQGVFEIEGLDDGDEVVVEVWVVIQSTFPSAGATGNVHSRLIDASTLTTEDNINTGTQTVPMMRMQDGGPEDDSEARLGTASVSDEDLLCL